MSQFRKAHANDVLQAPAPMLAARGAEFIAKD